MRTKYIIISRLGTSQYLRKLSIDSVNATSEAIRVAKNGGVVLWICNTVGQSQQQYQQFKDILGDSIKVGLLHSRFPFFRREELEDEWISRLGKGDSLRCPCILVATQVVEQSVDIDADLLITQLAPTDMLLQRLGREWRHERIRPAVEYQEVMIIDEPLSLEELKTGNPKDIKTALGGKANVYAPYILLRTLEVWKSKPEVIIPTDIRQLLDDTYSDRDEYPAWESFRNDWNGIDIAKAMVASRNTNYWQQALNDMEGCQTRLNELNYTTLVLCKTINDESVEFLDGTVIQITGQTVFNMALARAIHNNLVKIPAYNLSSSTPHPLFQKYIHDIFTIGIVNEDENVEVSGLKPGVSLNYNNNIGLIIDKNDAK